MKRCRSGYVKRHIRQIFLCSIGDMFKIEQVGAVCVLALKICCRRHLRRFSSARTLPAVPR